MPFCIVENPGLLPHRFPCSRISPLSPSRKPCTYFKARGRKQQENIGDLKGKAVQRHGNAWPVQPFFVQAAASIRTDTACMRPHSWAVQGRFLYTAYSHATRPYLHSYQALSAPQSGLTCKAEQGSSGHPAKAGGRPGRCFSPGDRRERLLADVIVYIYLRNKNCEVNIYCASCRYLCPISAGAVFPSRPALRRI